MMERKKKNQSNLIYILTFSSLSSFDMTFATQQAAHHLDLFFSNDLDTDAVRAARKFEMDSVRKWIDEKKGKYKALNSA